MTIIKQILNKFHTFIQYLSDFNHSPKHTVCPSDVSGVSTGERSGGYIPPIGESYGKNV